MALKNANPAVAIIGVTQETASILPVLLLNKNIRIVRILNPEFEDISTIQSCQNLDVIINATTDPAISDLLNALNLPGVDILSALSARIIFLSGGALAESGVDEEKGRILDKLNEIRQAVALAKNKEELLKLVLTLARKMNNADSGSIMLIDSADRTLKIEIADGLAPEIISSTAQKIGRGIAGRVVKSKEPIILNGEAAHEAGSGGNRPNLVSSICCPLIIGNEAVGAISINSTDPAHVFGEQELRYVKRLAAFTAEIIQAAKHYELASSSTFALSIIENARKIMQLSYSFDERLNLLLMRIANVLNAEICNYYQYHPDLKSFFVKASSSFRVSLLHGKVLKLNDYLSKRVLATLEATAIEIDDKKGIDRKWYVVHPVVVSGQLLGVIFLHVINNRADCRMEKDILCKISELMASELGTDVAKESFRIKSMKFSAISEASFDLASGGSRYELARVVVANACLILEAESAVLRLVNKKTGELESIDAFTLRNTPFLQELQPLDIAISRDAFANNEVLLMNTIGNDPRYADINFSVKSVLSMCLQRNGRRLGVLSLYNKRSLDFFRQHRFSDNDKEVFVNFCLQVAKAFSRFLI